MSGLMKSTRLEQRRADARWRGCDQVLDRLVAVADRLAEVARLDLGHVGARDLRARRTVLGGERGRLARDRGREATLSSTSLRGARPRASIACSR
jgi:hypothetical protein